MLPIKPYFLRAVYDWINDSNLTPYILVNAEAVGVSVPQEHVQNGQIVFNISQDACRNISVTKQQISFEASFSGVVMYIKCPIESIKAIYSYETGRGMLFDEDEDESSDGGGQEAMINISDSQQKTNGNLAKKKPKLSIVK
jgi:stringent starvation protein B